MGSARTVGTRGAAGFWAGSGFDATGAETVATGAAAWRASAWAISRSTSAVSIFGRIGANALLGLDSCISCLRGIIPAAPQDRNPVFPSPPIDCRSRLNPGIAQGVDSHTAVLRLAVDNHQRCVSWFKPKIHASCLARGGRDQVLRKRNVHCAIRGPFPSLGQQFPVFIRLYFFRGAPFPFAIFPPLVREQLLHQIDVVAVNEAEAYAEDEMAEPFLVLLTDVVRSVLQSFLQNPVGLELIRGG